MKLYRAN